MVAAGPDVASMIAAGAWDVPTSVGAVVLAVAVAGVVAMGLLWRSTGPSSIEAGSATIELRGETPAIVDLLTGGFQVEDDAVPATVVDLAARGHLDIEETGGRLTLRVREHGAALSRRDELADYEERVLTHVRSHAVDGRVPAEVLTIGPDGVSERWFRSFVRQVNRHGQSLGLCRRRFDPWHLAIAWAIVVVAAAPPYLVGAFVGRTDDPTGWGQLGNVLVGLAFLMGFALVWIAQRLSRSDAQRDTEAGRVAAAHWLGVRDQYRGAGSFEERSAASVAMWDRHLAYATAMGLAPVVQRQLPFETEHDRHAWSRATGRWRRVKVRYQSFVPGWGEPPHRLAFEGMVQAAVTGVLAYVAFTVSSTDFEVASLTDDQRRWIGFGALVVAVLAVAVCGFALVKLALGVSDLFARRTVEGEVVRARVLRTGHRLPRVVQWLIWSGRDEHGMQRDHRRRTRHHLAIDAGDDDSIVANVVRSEIYGQAPQGARVRAVVTPRIGYVRSIELVAPPRRSAASAATVHHELVEDTVRTAGDRLAGSIQGALEQLEGATDEQGRPILDQTDEDGVTFRQRLAESSDELDRLRHDPRVRSSPVAGLLDAFLSPDATRDDDGSSDGDR